MKSCNSAVYDRELARFGPSDIPTTFGLVPMALVAVGWALPGQKNPGGYYNLEQMLRSVLQKGATVKVCGTRMDARSLA